MILSLKDKTIHTTLFEKDINKYLCIPPGLAHPPGLVSGLIFGIAICIYTLCSDDKDCNNKLREFFTT
eukprot:11774653-Ditylum_brightwellii.AAC.1